MKLKIYMLALAMVLAGLILWPAKAGQTVKGLQLTHYYSYTNGSPIYEGAEQIATGARQLYTLYALNNSAAQIYLEVQDSANSGADNGPVVFVLPIAANSFVNVGSGISFKDFAKGIYLAPFTNAICTSNATSILFYSVDYQ